MTYFHIYFIIRERKYTNTCISLNIYIYISYLQDFSLSSTVLLRIL